MSDTILEPINILEIIKKPKSSKSEYKLKPKALSNLLEPCQDKHVAVIPIVGPSRKGKSFILNYMTRYLSDHTNNDWIGKTDTPLKGFDWKTDIKPQTSGIWMSPPYLFKRSDGQEIGIILMDTQGVFDKYSNERDWSTIVGISLLVSSCLIFNIISDLQEDSLSSLEKYLEYGLLAVKEDNKEEKNKPFQKLLFLIRDWNMPSQYAYGKEGGQKYLEEKLKDEEHQDEKAKKVRELLKDSFKDTECFLMPHIGDNSGEEDFNGSVEQLNQKFTRFLKKLIETLLNPEDIETKIETMKNRPIKGNELFEYFESYVKIFNSEDLPTAENLMEATQRVEYTIELNQILKKHKKQLKKLLESEEFVPQKKLRKENDKIQSKLIESIETNKYYEENQTMNKFESAFNEIFEENNRRRIDTINKCLIDCETEYNELTRSSMGSQFMDPYDLEMLFQRSKKKVFDKFQDKFNGEEEDVFRQEKIILIGKLNQIDMDLREVNTELRKQFQDLYSEILEKSINYYRNQFQTELSENRVLDLNQFKRVDKDLRRKTLDFFRDQAQKNSLKLDANYQIQLEQNIKQIKEESKDEFDDNHKRKMEDISQQLELAIQSYHTNIIDFMDGLTSITVLERKHKQFENQAFNQFIRKCMTTDETFLQPFKQEFYRRVNDLFEDFKTQEKKKTQNLRQRYQSKAEEIKNDYIQEMERLIDQNNNISDEELKRNHKKLRTDALKTYKESFESSGEIDSLLTTFSSDLKDAINEEFDRLLELNKIKRDEYNFNSKSDELFQLYETSIKDQQMTDNSQLSLKEFHNAFIVKITNEFRLLRSESGKIDTQNYLNKLKEKVEKLYRKVINELEESHQKINKFDGILSEILENYENKMDILFTDEKFYSDQSLENFHRKYKRDTLNKFRSYFENEQCDQLFIKNYNDKSDRLIEAKFEQIVELNQAKREEKDRLIADKIKNYSKLYEFDMNENFQSAESEEVLQTYHLKYEAKYLNQLKNQNPIRDPMLLQYYANSLKEELNFCFNTIKAKFNSNDIKNKIREAVNKYKQNMDKVITGDESIKTSTLFDYHDQFKEHATMLLESKLCEINVTNTTRYVTDLCSILDTEFETIKKNQEKKKESIGEQLRLSVEAFTLEFSKSLSKEVTAFDTELDLKDKQKTLKLEIIDQFLGSNRTADRTALNSFRKLLEQKIDDTIEESMMLWEKQSQNNEKMLKYLKQKLRSLYSAEMEKYVRSGTYHLNEKMDEYNETVLKLVYEKCKSDKENMSDNKYMAFIRESVEDIFKKKKEENAMRIPVTPAIGIDLGTTNCCVAIFKRDSVVIIPNELKRNTTPSFISLRDEEEVVGDVAKEEMYAYPRNTIHSAKRLIGQQINDPSVQKYISLMSYDVKDDGFNNPKICVNVNRQEWQYFPEEISSILLKKLKKNAENYLGRPVTKAVITVPAYFNDSQKEATKDAGKLAGLEVLRIVNEPTASAIAYSLNHKDDLGARNVLIFDFGGGTFDVAVLEVDKGNINVKSVGGDNNLGGDDFDNNIMEYCLQRFKQITGLTLDGPEREVAICRLRIECEKHKCRLASVESTGIAIHGFYEDNDLNIVLTRKKFEEINADLMQRSMDLVDRALEDAKVSHTDIDDIVLVGGTTRIPKVQQMLSKKFNGRALSHYLDPDEVVARGAAIQAAILNGQTADKLDLISLSDVTPMSLGIELGDDKMSVIIPRNSKVPSTATQKYQTNTETEMIIKVFEGESDLCSQNHCLGSFLLSGIPQSYTGGHTLAVTFKVNDEGILNVTAKIEGTGVENVIQIDKQIAKKTDL